MGSAPERAATHEDSHDPHLAHHFDSPKQQFDSGKLGMWIFLTTEILFFSGLFCAYAVYRSTHPEVFAYGQQYLDVTLGAINTAVLILSSLTIAWGVRCAQLGQRRGLVVLLSLTIVCACIFLGIKYVEYAHKWHEGLLWGTEFQPTAHETNTGAGEGAEAGAETDGATRAAPELAHVFFGIYFALTGLHGLHVIIGIAVIGWILARALKGEFHPGYYAPVDLTALYWHLVDLVWIFLFPLLYLVRS